MNGNKPDKHPPLSKEFTAKLPEIEKLLVQLLMHIDLISKSELPGNALSFGKRRLIETYLVGILELIHKAEEVFIGNEQKTLRDRAIKLYNTSHIKRNVSLLDIKKAGLHPDNFCELISIYNSEHNIVSIEYTELIANTAKKTDNTLGKK